jgi:hypothetical protein
MNDAHESADAGFDDGANVADRNVQRLLSSAYQPEVPDAQFVAQTRQRLRSVATQAARGVSVASKHDAVGNTATNWRILAACGIAAGLLIALSVWNGGTDNRESKAPRPKRDSSVERINFAASEQTSRPVESRQLTARPRDAAPQPNRVALGDVVETQAGQRRRLMLPDGSVLYMNQSTKVHISGDRRLALARPRPGLSGSRTAATGQRAGGRRPGHVRRQDAAARRDGAGDAVRGRRR